jgi:hypothetical protein
VTTWSNFQPADDDAQSDGDSQDSVPGRCEEGSAAVCLPAMSDLNETG